MRHIFEITAEISAGKMANQQVKKYIISAENIKTRQIDDSEMLIIDVDEFVENIDAINRPLAKAMDCQTWAEGHSGLIAIDGFAVDGSI